MSEKIFEIIPSGGPFDADLRFDRGTQGASDYISVAVRAPRDLIVCHSSTGIHILLYENEESSSKLALFAQPVPPEISSELAESVARQALLLWRDGRLQGPNNVCYSCCGRADLCSINPDPYWHRVRICGDCMAEIDDNPEDELPW